MKAHLILYVSDQQAATAFYASVLAMTPSLDVPGMTEYALNDGCILGLMPEGGIKRLLGEALPDPSQATGIPRAELYLRVDQPEIYHRRAIQFGAKELSPVEKRNWGDIAGYSLDRDGHVIAFAKSIENPIHYEQLNPKEMQSSHLKSFLTLDQAIFGEQHAAGLADEISRKHAPTLFIAMREGEVVGYKLGYERKPHHYHSWLGSVALQYRGQGIATKLMEAQHNWCKENGYVAIRTQTKNKWREMILLNIKSGFQIIGTFTDDEGEPKIILEKALI